MKTYQKDFTNEKFTMKNPILVNGNKKTSHQKQIC